METNLFIIARIHLKKKKGKKAYNKFIDSEEFNIIIQYNKIMHTHKMKWNEIKEKVTKKSRRKYYKIMIFII